jgi:hypothetical protein
MYIDSQNVNSHTNEYFKDHIILCTWNDTIDSINNGIIDIFPRVRQTLLNVDVALLEVGVNNHNLYPIEYSFNLQ